MNKVSWIRCYVVQCEEVYSGKLLLLSRAYFLHTEMLGASHLRTHSGDIVCSREMQHQLLRMAAK